RINSQRIRARTRRIGGGGGGRGRGIGGVGNRRAGGVRDRSGTRAGGRGGYTRGATSKGCAAHCHGGAGHAANRRGNIGGSRGRPHITTQPVGSGINRRGAGRRSRRTAGTSLTVGSTVDGGRPIRAETLRECDG